MSHVVVLGGFTESRGLLEPVADVAVEQGLGHDAAVLTLAEAAAMDDETRRALMAGSSVLTHSAGLLSVPDARNRISDSELPEGLIVVAGPEPRSVGRLAASGTRKLGNQAFGQSPHSRRSNLRVIAGNVAEGARHPGVALSSLAPISRFSTANQLDTGRAAATRRLGDFMMTEDVYFRDPHWRDRAALQDLRRNGAVVAELPGRHDELLIDPERVLRGITMVFAAAEAETLSH